METLLQCFVKLVQIFNGLFIVNSAVADSISLTIPPCLSTSTLRSWIRQLGHGLDGWAFLPIETSSVSKPERKFSGFFQVPWCGETGGLLSAFDQASLCAWFGQMFCKSLGSWMSYRLLCNFLTMPWSCSLKDKNFGPEAVAHMGVQVGMPTLVIGTVLGMLEQGPAPRLGLGACDVPTLICSDSLFSANTQIRMWLGMAFRCRWSFERFLQVSAPKSWISCVNLLRAIECRIGSSSIHPASPVMYLSKPLPARMAPTRKFGRSCWMFRKTSCMGIVHV